MCSLDFVNSESSGTSAEKMPLSDWPLARTDMEGPSSLCPVSPWACGLGSTKMIAELKPGNRSVSSVPLWPML